MHAAEGATRTPPTRLIVLVIIMSCSTVSPPISDVSGIVFGRITSTSGVVVRGATVIIETTTDSTGQAPWSSQCTGSSVLAVRREQLDTAGFYRIELRGRAVAGRRVCVEVTGDPHGIFSDIGLKRVFGGWLELRPSDGLTPRDSVRVDVRYTEMS